MSPLVPACSLRLSLNLPRKPRRSSFKVALSNVSFSRHILRVPDSSRRFQFLKESLINLLTQVSLCTTMRRISIWPGSYSRERCEITAYSFKRCLLRSIIPGPNPLRRAEVIGGRPSAARLNSGFREPARSNTRARWNGKAFDPNPKRFEGA